jgi:hypothetical protein
MWLVITIGLGIFALIGLLAVAKELFGDGSLDAHTSDAGVVTSQHDVGRATARRRVMTR